MEKGIKCSWPFVKPGVIMKEKNGLTRNVFMFYEMDNQCVVGWESHPVNPLIADLMVEVCCSYFGVCVSAAFQSLLREQKSNRL